MRIMVALATTATALVLATPAHAVLLQFTINGLDLNSTTNPGALEYASFQIDSNPTIAPGDSVAGYGFFVRQVPGTYTYGSTTFTTPQDISFYTAVPYNGGLFVGNGSLLAYDGPQLYTGSESAPMFSPGLYTLTDYYDGSPILLTITLAATPAVPEPASWALMIAGFGLAGAALRVRRRTVTFSRA